MHAAGRCGAFRFILFGTSMPFSHISLLEQKRLIRSEMRTKRQELARNNQQLINDLLAVFKREVKLEPGAIIGSYQPFRDELAPTLLIDYLRENRHPIALPVIIGKALPLVFRLYTPSDLLITNKMGIQEPADAAKAVDPDILLVPLLAFDGNRNRLGYGGGFYDRTIADLRTRKSVLAIGLAFAFQEIPIVPTGNNDIQLDRIVTEVNVF